MFKLIVVLSLLVSVVLVGNLAAQDNSQKTRDLVAALDKTKYKKKDKGNISVEVYVDIKNESVVKADATEYSGRYEADGYLMVLTVGKDGLATGSGHDELVNSDRSVDFELKGARVDGALLSGTKVYAGGRQEPFQAVFVNRTSKSGKNPNSIDDQSTKFGIGFIQTSHQDSEWTNRVFLERR